MSITNNETRVPNSNRLAALLHPSRQEMVITDVLKTSRTMTTYVMKAADEHELAYFEAGCYIPVYVEIDGNVIERPYGLSSSPKQATQGIYAITVKAADGGYVSNYIHENWKVGMKVTLGAPAAAETYNPTRDAKKVIAIAGGVGVTPFMSMAQSIVDGDTDCELTLFYGVNTEEDLIFQDKWKELEQESNGKFKYVQIVADDQSGKYEHGFITLDIINKYSDVNNSTIFISGPSAMVAAVKAFLEPLGIRRKFIRVSMSGDSAFNHVDANVDAYTLTVHMAGESYRVQANPAETILAAVERAGLKPAVRCRSGKCGFCRSMVISGDFELADAEASVRKADKRLGFIHPCCSYPRSDMEIVVQRNK